MAGNLSQGQQRVLFNAAKDQLKGTFVDHPLWELERVLGHGSYGVTALLRDKGARRFGLFGSKIRKPKRVVLKRPIYRQAGIRDFDNEIRALKLFKGLAHHVQTLGTTGDVSDYQPKSRGGFRETLKTVFAPFRNPPSNIFTILGHYQGPAILLEYIENGTLLSLHNKIWERQIVLPNRLLWRFYLCLVRGICGMAFEQEGHKKGQPLVLEVVPRYGEQREFWHGDVASRNIMIGEWDPKVEDHRITPVLKFIDYGFSRLTGDADEALRENLMHVSILMLFLINKNALNLDFQNLAAEHKGALTFAANIVPLQNGADPCPTLDVELRDLLAEALRTNVGRRPSLSEIFMRIQNGMAKTAASYPNRELEESDASIEARLQQLLHDA